MLSITGDAWLVNDVSVFYGLQCIIAYAWEGRGRWKRETGKGGSGKGGTELHGKTPERKTRERIDGQPARILIEMWQSSNSNSTTFELRTFLAYSEFDECFRRFVVECEIVKKFLTTVIICTESHRVQNLFFSEIQPTNLPFKLQLLNARHNCCVVMCYTVVTVATWTLFLLTYR